MNRLHELINQAYELKDADKGNLWILREGKNDNVSYFDIGQEKEDGQSGIRSFFRYEKDQETGQECFRYLWDGKYQFYSNWEETPFYSDFTVGDVLVARNNLDEEEYLNNLETALERLK